MFWGINFRIHIHNSITHHSPPASQPKPSSTIAKSPSTCDFLSIAFAVLSRPRASRHRLSRVADRVLAGRVLAYGVRRAGLAGFDAGGIVVVRSCR
jgi:hypothetical protein